MRRFLGAFYGFVAAAVLAGAGLFLVSPNWNIGVVCLLLVGLLISGRIPAAIGVAMVAIALVLSPFVILGMIGMAAGHNVNASNKSTRRQLNEKCAVDLAPLRKASAKYGLVVFDSIETRGENNYDIADTLAVLTGMRVVQIGRAGLDRHFNEAWETTAGRSGSCAGERDSAKVGVTPRGSQRSTAPLAVDVCLRRTNIPDPSGDRTPAIVLRNDPVPDGSAYCHYTAVVERMESGDVELGRVHYDSFQHRMYPNLALPRGVPQSNWLHVLLGEVLQQDLSEEALMGHAVKTMK